MLPKMLVYEFLGKCPKMTLKNTKINRLKIDKNTKTNIEFLQKQINLQKE